MQFPSAYQAYRELLCLLVDDDYFTDSIRKFKKTASRSRPNAVDLNGSAYNSRNANGGRALERIWKRTFARFDPDQPVIATLLYETCDKPQELCVIEVNREPISGVKDGNSSGNQQESEWLRLTAFPHDDALPTLAKVIERHPTCTVLRYRPGKRCTFKFAGENGEVFGKVFPDKRGKRLFEESGLLWEAARRGVLDFNVAMPVGWDEAANVVYHSAVPGESVLPGLFRPQASTLAYRMGRALASLHTSGLEPESIFDDDVQMQRTEKYARVINDRIPALRDTVYAFLESLRSLHKSLPALRLVAIHGSPHAHQWLDAGGRLGLIDFDRFSLGHPELDLATFIAEMDYENPEKTPIKKIHHALLAGYRLAGGQVDESWLKIYRAHKRFAKAFKAAKSVRPNGEKKAIRNVHFAMECLESFGSLPGSAW